MSESGIVIVDYGLGNLFSVKQACLRYGIDPLITNVPEVISAAQGIILPGVGAFHEAMQSLRESGAAQAMKVALNSGAPLFGICLGMQLLFDSSEEFGSTPGLGLISGSIRRIPDEGRRVPHIGWNPVYPARQSWEGSPMEGIDSGTHMYFVHSYRVVPADPGDVLCQTEYKGLEYCAAVRKGLIFATQFHPEKSGKQGLRIYENWLRLAAQSHAGKTKTAT